MTLLAYYNKEAKDDSDDFVTSVFHDWRPTVEEARVFQLRATMVDEKITRLGILVSEAPQAPPLLPRYVRTHRE
jgi:hypothetical protein